MKLELECMYCGYKWDKVVYNQAAVESESCPKCKDLNLKVRDFNASKIDTYKGSPPFPVKIKEDSGWPWGMSNQMSEEMDQIRNALFSSLSIPPDKLG